MSELESTLDIKLKYIAVALLDLENDKLVEATKVLQLNRSQHSVFYEFFEQYFEITMNSPKSVACKFLDADNDILTKIARFQEQQDKDHFMKMTNELASKLFKIMQTVSNSNGSMFVVQAELIGEEYLLLMKIDPKTAIQLDVDTLDMKTIENVLPEAGDRVHKCALIRMNYDPTEENVYVLDKQSDTEPAKFFMETFLQATPIPTDKKKTKILMKELFESIKPTIEEEDTIKLQKVISDEFEHGKLIQIDEAVTNVYSAIAQGENKEEYIERETKQFVEQFAERNPDFTPKLEIKRDDLHFIYKSKENEITFKYDKRLSNVSVKHDQTNGTYTITIRNVDAIEFGLRKG